MSLSAALSKIRPHTSSTLAHQKAPANLLLAIEQTLTEQNSEKNATAYFAALLTTLESSARSNPTFGEGDVLPAIIYLLALVTPFVSQAVIRSNLTAIMALTGPLFSQLIPHAPPLRSQLTLLSAVIQAVEPSQLDTPNVRTTFSLVLDLTVDPRPKVRRRAADLVREVLENPPTPLLRHPYNERVGEWVATTLAAVSSGATMFGRQKKAEGTTDAPEVGIHVIAMVKPIASLLPESHLPAITSSLLSLPRLGNPYLSQASYALLASLVTTSTSSASSSDLTPLLSALLSSAPLKSDSAQTPAWLELLRAAFSAGPISSSLSLAETFKTVFGYLESNDAVARNGVAQALAALLANSLSNETIEKAITEYQVSKSQKKVSSPLSKTISHIRSSFDTLPYARAVPQMLTILASLIHCLSYRPALSSLPINAPLPPSAAELLVLDMVKRAGELRIKKDFEYKESADEVLKSAMAVVGPEVLLKALPLGLLPEERTSSTEPHAYLLPLLQIPHPAPLSHFVSYFVPLSERMFDLNQKAEMEGRANEAKMWDVLIGQVWAGLTGYCWNTRDLSESFNPTFAQLLSQILYNQPQLRSSILKALKIVVESNLQATATATDFDSESQSQPLRETFGDARRNILHLRSQTESWFAVLFNVFGSVGQEGKGMVGDVISAWVKIAGDQEIIAMYKKVVTLLKQNLSKPTLPKGSEAPNMTLMAQDLLVLLLPSLPLPQCEALWSLCISPQVIGHSDPAIQKRGYRILSKLISTSRLSTSATFNTEAVLTQLTTSADSVGAPAKRDRITLLAALIPRLGKDELHVVPVLIPEAVLATKEPAERTRGAAFDLVVGMGRVMREGGVVRRSRVEGMVVDEGVDEVQATIEEYITMVAAGLVGGTPHMISATITAISRLVFEFKDDISQNMLTEILSTVLVFVTSANREIVKSALGFIKLSIHTLPVDLVIPHLKDLVPALLNWSGDHKNHFKVKVRHIFERMIRRFGWEAVYQCVGEDQAEKGKVLLNIKKRKDRAKRKKAKAAEQDEDEGEEDGVAGKKTGDAFEDVLYGSESEIEDSDDDADQPSSRQKNASSRRNEKEREVRIRLDNDEPMDLLHGAAEKLLSGNKNRRRKPGQEASRFKEDEATGKMVIDDEDAQEEEGYEEEDIAGVAYKETLTSVDGFRRDARGRVKFNKDTKKRRANEEEEDVEMGDATGVSNAPSGKSNKKQKKEFRLGKEFKAKNAGGDVKKGGVDPYAYLPLSQASAKKKGGKAANVRLVGRR